MQTRQDAASTLECGGLPSLSCGQAFLDSVCNERLRGVYLPLVTPILRCNAMDRVIQNARRLAPGV